MRSGPLAALVLGCLAAAPGPAAAEPPACDVRAVGLDAPAFYRYLTEDTPFRLWDLWPGTARGEAVSGYHGASTTIHVNAAALASIRGGAAMAPGSLIVLESFDARGAPAGLCAMLKIRGFEPAAGDWHWSQYDAGGNPLVSGRAPTCLACHGERAADDYVITGRGAGPAGAVPGSVE